MRLTYALIWRLISREISAGGSAEEEVCRCRSISRSIVSGRQDLTHRRAPFPILVSRSVYLATTKGQFPGRRRGNCVVVLSGLGEDGRRTTFRRKGTKSEGRARQENSENVGFHKGTITIVKAEEGARQQASVGYLGGPTAKFSPPLLEYIIPPPPFA